MQLRPAHIEDLEDIIAIYNQAVHDKFATADIELIRPEERLHWLKEHTVDQYPLYVMDHESEIVGWVSVSPYRPGRKALRYTVEVSYYVHKNFRRQGIGETMMHFIIEHCKALSYKSLFAIVLERNIGSIKLLEKTGFKSWGYLPDVADFEGIECGHLYYGLRIA